MRLTRLRCGLRYPNFNPFRHHVFRLTACLAALYHPAAIHGLPLCLLSFLITLARFLRVQNNSLRACVNLYEITSSFVSLLSSSLDTCLLLLPTKSQMDNSNPYDQPSLCKNILLQTPRLFARCLKYTSADVYMHVPKSGHAVSMSGAWRWGLYIKCVLSTPTTVLRTLGRMQR
jgi:hypothetical protein